MLFDFYPLNLERIAAACSCWLPIAYYFYGILKHKRNRFSPTPTHPQSEGKPIEVLLGCLEPEGETADAVKKAIDKVVLSYMSEHDYERKCVSVCCDGAAVNMAIIRAS